MTTLPQVTPPNATPPNAVRTPRAASTVLRRTVAAIALVAGAALALGACSAGQHTGTAHQRPVVDGASGQAGAVKLQFVGLTGKSTGSYKAGDTVPLTLVIINNGQADDRLLSVSSPAAASAVIYASSLDAARASAAASSATASPSGGPAASPSATASTTTPSTTTAPSATASGSPSTSATVAPAVVDLPAGTAVSIGVQNSSGPVVVLQRLTQALGGGEAVDVTFTFANAGSVTIAVPVRLGKGAAEDAPTVEFSNAGH